MVHPSRATEGRATAPSGRGSPSRRRRAVAVASLVGLISAPVVATPASAAITPVAPPYNLEVFPAVDVAGAQGFALNGQPITLEVWRNGVKVGTSGTPKDSVTGPEGPVLEINHDAEPCWDGVTPDIIPGDELRVVTDGSNPDDPVGMSMTVANIDAEPAKLVALDSDGAVNDVVMTGTASTVDGTAALPIARLQAEIVQPEWRNNTWGGQTHNTRAIGAVAGLAVPNATTPFGPDDEGVLSYDPVSATNPLGNHWTAVWKNMPEPIGTLALSGEHVVIFADSDLGEEGTGLTLMDAEDASGPAAECAHSPAASDAVVSTVPAAANIAFVNGTRDLTVSGTAYNAASVSLTLNDSSAATAPLTVNAVLNNAASTAETSAPVAPVRQTWSATFPKAAVAALADGDLTISGTFNRVIEAQEERQVTDPTTGTTTTTTVYTHNTTPMPGRDHVLVKDTVVPAAPTAFPGTGRYSSNQSVTFSAADEIEDVVRYRVGADAASTPAPTAASPIVPSPYLVTSSQTVKVRSFDRAGNPSAVATFTYTIGAPTAPPAPTGVTASAGTQAGTAVVDWTSAGDGGSAITSHQIQVISSSGTRTITGISASVSSYTVTGLTAGTYTFKVRAVNSVGSGTLSAASNSVTVAGAGGGTVAAPSTPDLRNDVGQSTTDNITNTQPRFGGTAAPGSTVRIFVNGVQRGSGVASSTGAYLVSTTGVPAGSNLQVTATATTASGTSAASQALTITIDRTRPTVTSRVPGINATGVRRSPNLTATVSERVYGVTTGNVTLRVGTSATGTLVPRSVQYVDTTRTIVINPSSNLAASTQYTVRLLSGVRDIAGNAILTTTASPTTWSFRTGTAL